MKNFLLALALLSASAVQAQQFSAGARTGVGFWRGSEHNPETGLAECKRQTLWEKEIFFRFEPGGRFAYEAGLMHFAAEGSKPSGLLCATGAESYLASGTIRDQFYGLNLRMQYNFTRPEMGRFSHFAGVALTPQLHVAETKDNMYNPATEQQSTVQSTVYQHSFGFAVEDLLRYRINNHFDVHSLIACRGNTNSTLLVHGFTMQLGAAYRF